MAARVAGATVNADEFELKLTYVKKKKKKGSLALLMTQTQTQQEGFNQWILAAATTKNKLEFHSRTKLSYSLIVALFFSKGGLVFYFVYNLELHED